MEPLITLIERWHAHERDGDPEADRALRDLEIRLAAIAAYATALVDTGVNCVALVQYIDGDK